MPIYIENPRYVPPPLGLIKSDDKTIDKNKPFLDYFPNLRENYQGYIAQDIFKSKMIHNIAEAIREVGRLGDYCEEKPQPASSINSSGLNEMTKKRAIANYYYDIKAALTDRIWGEEWRKPNEMHTSAEMYAQSNAYFKSAGMDAGIGIATFGIGKGLKKLANLKTQGIHRIAKKKTPKGLISVGTYKDTVNGHVYDSAFKVKFTRNMKNKNFLEKEINPLNVFKGKSMVSNVSYASMDMVDINLFDVTKKVWEYNIDEYKNLLETSDFESFNCMDYGYESSVAQNINKGIDIGTDFIPLVGLAKTITNIGFNTVLGFQTRAVAHRMKKMDDKNNVAEHNLNQDLKKKIYDDIYLLHYEEIEALIDKAGLKELTK